MRRGLGFATLGAQCDRGGVRSHPRPRSGDGVNSALNAAYVLEPAVQRASLAPRHADEMVHGTLGCLVRIICDIVRRATTPRNRIGRLRWLDRRIRTGLAVQALRHLVRSPRTTSPCWRGCARSRSVAGGRCCRGVGRAHCVDRRACAGWRHRERPRMLPRAARAATRRAAESSTSDLCARGSSSAKHRRWRRRAADRSLGFSP